MSVREAQQRIAADEFSEWMAFCQIEPFGDEWRQAGVMAWASVAAMGGGRKSKPEDFMPRLQRRRQTVGEMTQSLKLWALANGNHRKT